MPERVPELWASSRAKVLPAFLKAFQYAWNQRVACGASERFVQVRRAVPVRWRVAGSYRRMREDHAQLSKIGREAGDVELIQRAQRVVECRLERMRRVRLADDLGEHRIELRRGVEPQIAAGIATWVSGADTGRSQTCSRTTRRTPDMAVSIRPWSGVADRGGILLGRSKGAVTE